MTSLDLNKQKIWYSLYSGVTDIYDTNGDKTGEKEKVYYNPVPARMNVSAARGSAEVEAFGISEDYDRIITTSNVNCPIAEDTILWIGVTPGSTASSIPYNYRVVKVAKSINSVLYAVKEVRKP